MSCISSGSWPLTQGSFLCLTYTGQFPQDPPCSLQRVSPLFLLLDTSYHQPAVPVPILRTAETEPSLNALFSLLSAHFALPVRSTQDFLPWTRLNKAIRLIPLCYPLFLTEASLQAIGASFFFPHFFLHPLCGYHGVWRNSQIFHNSTLYF